MTHCIVGLTLLWWSGTKLSISLQSACTPLLQTQLQEGVGSVRVSIYESERETIQCEACGQDPEGGESK